MIDRFEKLTNGISQIYKSIQKIKKEKMNALGLKGTHVMCIYYLNSNPEGLTAADLCHLCQEDKAAVSRILSDLEANGFICYDRPQDGKKYRAKAFLTEKGRNSASKIYEQIIHAVSDASKDISDNEREIFYRVLFLIADNLNQICEKQITK